MKGKRGKKKQKQDKYILKKLVDKTKVADVWVG
jgi:hypothetical protein